MLVLKLSLGPKMFCDTCGHISSLHVRLFEQSYGHCVKQTKLDETTRDWKPKTQLSILFYDGLESISGRINPSMSHYVHVIVAF